MIPDAYITAWSVTAPWSTRDELVFRGGTCLHKMHLSRPLRYSEDLDYVRTTQGPIGGILDALRDVASSTGMVASTGVGKFPKLFFRSSFESGYGRLQVKVEINTYDIPASRSLVRLPMAVDSPWWSGEADVLTFERYRPDGCTAALAIENLREHAADRGFRADLAALVVDDTGFDVDQAALLVIEELLSKLEGATERQAFRIRSNESGA